MRSNIKMEDEILRLEIAGYTRATAEKMANERTKNGPGLCTLTVDPTKLRNLDVAEIPPPQVQEEEMDENGFLIETFAQWEKYKKSGKTLIVNFCGKAESRYWCVPCKRMSELWREQIEKHSSNESLLFLFVPCAKYDDASEDQQRITSEKEADIEGFPTFQIWQNGKRVQELQEVGLKDEYQTDSTLPESRKKLDDFVKEYASGQHNAAISTSSSKKNEDINQNFEVRELTEEELENGDFISLIDGKTLLNKEQNKRTDACDFPWDADFIGHRCLQFTNFYRKKKGLQLCVWSEELKKLAVKFSEKMARGEVDEKAFEEHEGFEERFAEFPDNSHAGENLSMKYGKKFGPFDVAFLFVDGWIHSPSHEQNLSFSHYTHCGIGVARDDKGEFCATQFFYTEKRSAAKSSSARPKREIQRAIVQKFKQWDKNGDGGIDRKEMKAVLVALGIPGQDVNQLFKDADVNHDGKVDCEEFMAWLFGDAAEAGTRQKVVAKAEEIAKKGK